MKEWSFFQIGRAHTHTHTHRGRETRERTRCELVFAHEDPHVQVIPSRVLFGPFSVAAGNFILPAMKEKSAEKGQDRGVF